MISHKRVFEHFYATCAPNWNCVHIKAAISLFYSSSLSSISFSRPSFSLSVSLFSLFGPSDQGVMDRQAHRCVERTRMRCCAQWSALRRVRVTAGRGRGGARRRQTTIPGGVEIRDAGREKESEVNKYKSLWAMLRKCSSFQGHNNVSVVMRLFKTSVYMYFLFFFYMRFNQLLGTKLGDYLYIYIYAHKHLKIKIKSVCNK